MNNCARVEGGGLVGPHAPCRSLPSGDRHPKLVAQTCLAFMPAIFRHRSSSVRKSSLAHT